MGGIITTNSSENNTYYEKNKDLIQREDVIIKRTSEDDKVYIRKGSNADIFFTILNTQNQGLRIFSSDEYEKSSEYEEDDAPIDLEDEFITEEDEVEFDNSVISDTESVDQVSVQENKLSENLLSFIPYIDSMRKRKNIPKSTDELPLLDKLSLDTHTSTTENESRWKLLANSDFLCVYELFLSTKCLDGLTFQNIRNDIASKNQEVSSITRLDTSLVSELLKLYETIKTAFSEQYLTNSSGSTDEGEVRVNSMILKKIMLSVNQIAKLESMIIEDIKTT